MRKGCRGPQQTFTSTLSLSEPEIPTSEFHLQACDGLVLCN